MKQFCKAKTRESVSSGCAACEIHPVMKMEVDRYCPVGMPDSAFKMPNHSAFRKRIDSRVTLSNSRNAVSLTSACTTKRFPSPRCASAIQIVRPSLSKAETQPQAPTGFAEIALHCASVARCRAITQLHFKQPPLW